MFKNKSYALVALFKQWWSGLWPSLDGTEAPTTSVKAVGISTEPVSTGAISHAEMFKDIIKAPVITHANFVNLSRAFFDIDVDSNLFCFRSGGPYGLVMVISSVGVTSDDAGAIIDIKVHLADYSLDTSLRMSLSVKDLNEMFRPFHLKSPLRASS